MKQENKKPFTARINAGLIKRLRMYSASEESKMGEVVTKALEQYLRENTKQRRLCNESM